MLIMKILQTNLGRAYTAHDLAHESACKLNIDILTVVEPNKKIVKKRGWLTDNLVNVAIYIRNPKCGIQSVTKREGYIIIKFKDMTLIPCYISPNIRLEEYKRIERIELNMDLNAENLADTMISNREDFESIKKSCNEQKEQEERERQGRQEDI